MLIMGKAGRLRKERIASGKEQGIRAKLHERSSMAILEFQVNKLGRAIRPNMLDGAKTGMRDHLLTLRKEGKEITLESIQEEFRNNQKFLDLCARVDITLEDFNRMAQEVLDEESMVIL